MINLILPEAINQLQLRLKVRSEQVIPAFDPQAMGCDYSGKINISPSYKSNSTKGDVLIFLYSQNIQSHDFLALAAPCLLGNLLLWYFILNCKILQTYFTIRRIDFLEL